MVFTVKSSQDVIEWKVCAYTNDSGQAHSYPAVDTAGTSQTAITKLTGSISNGYTGTNAANSSIRVWNVIVDGNDYRNALGGSSSVNVDGTHYVAVYVKNKAGLWSKATAKAS